jgi:hypothetical protein
MIHSSLCFNNSLNSKEQNLFQKILDLMPYHYNRLISFQENDVPKIFDIYEQIQKTQNIDFQYDHFQNKTHWKYIQKIIKDYKGIFPNEKMENHFIMFLYSRKIYDLNIELKTKNEIIIREHHSELKNSDYNHSTIAVQLAYLKDLLFHERLKQIYDHQYFNKNNIYGKCLLPINEKQHSFDTLKINALHDTIVKREKKKLEEEKLDWEIDYAQESFDAFSEKNFQILLHKHQLLKMDNQNQNNNKIKI